MHKTDLCMFLYACCSSEIGENPFAQNREREKGQVICAKYGCSISISFGLMQFTHFIQALYVYCMFNHKSHIFKVYYLPRKEK